MFPNICSFAHQQQSNNKYAHIVVAAVAQEKSQQPTAQHIRCCSLGWRHRRRLQSPLPPQAIKPLEGTTASQSASQPVNRQTTRQWADNGYCCCCLLLYMPLLLCISFPTVVIVVAHRRVFPDVAFQLVVLFFLVLLLLLLSCAFINKDHTIWQRDHPSVCCLSLRILKISPHIPFLQQYFICLCFCLIFFLFIAMSYTNVSSKLVFPVDISLSHRLRLLCIFFAYCSRWLLKGHLQYI